MCVEIEFSLEFVLCADNYTFSTQLCNELKARISDIESVQVQRIMDDVLTETVNTCRCLLFFIHSIQNYCASLLSNLPMIVVMTLT